MLPVEDLGNKHLADWSRNRRELGHSRRDVQAAVDEVAEGIDLILRVLLGHSVHLLEFLNQKARRACFGRVEVADFCLELTGSLSLSLVGDVGASRASTYVDEHRLAQLLNQVLGLRGIEGGLLLSWCWYGMALFVLLKAAGIIKVVLKVVHRFCKCGVLLYGRGGKFRLECQD